MASPDKSNYKVGLGWNLSLVSLTLLNPQPRSPGVKATRRSYYQNGVYDEGLFVELLWSALEDSAQYRSILGFFDLINLTQQIVTIYCRDDTWVYRRYNGSVYRPLVGEGINWDFFPRDVTIIVRDLVLIP